LPSPDTVYPPAASGRVYGVERLRLVDVAGTARHADPLRAVHAVGGLDEQRYPNRSTSFLAAAG
jgi:hypothetical protein